MNKTLRFLSMVALVLMGAMMTGCTSSELVNEQPENNDKIVTLTTTVGFDAASTKALADGGVKTFADGDQIAVIYKNTSGETVKAVSEAISSGAGTSSAAFTVTLTNPNKTQAIRYIYPAAMAKETVATDATMDDAGTVDFTNLDSQDGTLATLGSKYDLCTFDAENWTSGTLPTATLDNQLAILAITLMDDATPTANDITSSIKGLNLTYGTNSYTITRSAGDGPIYVAIRPTSSSADIEVTATDGTYLYGKSLSSKTYEINNGYSVSWKMNKILTRIHSGNALTVMMTGCEDLSDDNAAALAKECWTVVGGTVYIVSNITISMSLSGISFSVSYTYTSNGIDTYPGTATGTQEDYHEVAALYKTGSTAWYVEK